MRRRTRPTSAASRPSRTRVCRYYLVAILFIIFDLEIAFLFPWAVAFRDIGVTGFVAMMVFLGVLVIGFVYEWKKGALEWE
jgi:NADH-quinone oxidoreductase subunit A